MMKTHYILWRKNLINNFFKKLFRQISILFLIILIICLFNINVFAQEQQEESKEESAIYIIKDISVQGNYKTKTRIIIQELEFKINQTFNNLEDLNYLIKESKRKLKNWEIFSLVDIKYDIKEGNNIFVIIVVEERWTLFPVPGYSYSSIYGSTYSFSLTDANFFGLHWNFGTVISFNEYNKSFILNFVNPRFFGSYYSFTFYLYYRDYIETIYNNNNLVYESNINSIYLYTSLSKVLNNHINIYIDLNLEYRIFNTSLNLIDKNEIELNQSLLGIGIIFNNTEYYYGIKDGFYMEINGGLSPFILGNFEVNLGLKLILCKIFFKESMFSLRFSLKYLYSNIGNFYILTDQQIRGIKNGEIFGNFGFYSNIETHLKLFNLNWPFLIKFYLPVFLDFSLFDKSDFVLTVGSGIKIYPAPINLTIRINFVFNIFNYIKGEQYFFLYFGTADYF